MPKVDRRVELHRLRIQPASQINQTDSSRTREYECPSFMLTGPIAQQKQSNREPCERKCAPGKDWKQPALRLIKIVYAIYVRLHRPGQPARTPVGPHPACQQSN